MAVRRFEDLIAWQKAQDLGVDVFFTYEHVKDFTFKNQVWGAAISVSNNISEGFDRGSNADFIRFLNFARTSCNEVKSMSYLAARIGYLTEKQKSDFIQKTEELSKIILGLINSLR